MNQSSKMTLKAFTEEYTQILNGYGVDELRCILTNMALDISSEYRREFIEQLLNPKPLSAQKVKPTESTLDEIEYLIEDIRDQSEQEPDWGRDYDDEDSLAEFSDFIPRIYQVFDKVEALFDYGDFHLARKGFDALYTIFDIQDDYGRGISLHDLEELNLEEIKARYLRSIYLTESSVERASQLLNAMLRLSALSLYSPRPKLEDMINISITTLPEWTEFLETWLHFIKDEADTECDAWYREATYLLSGIPGLKDLAKKEGQQRPKVYVDWVSALIDIEDYRAALDASDLALEKLPKAQPIRASIGDLQAICGKQLNNENISLKGHWVSFEVKPSLNKLVMLYQRIPPLEQNTFMQEAAHSIESYKERIKDYSKGGRWSGDRIESPAYPDSSLLMHAYLFSHNYEDAFKLAQQGTVLGWSSNSNPQPIFIGFCLARAANQSLTALPRVLKSFFQGILLKSSDGFYDDESQNDLFRKLEKIYTKLLIQTPLMPQEILNWCLQTAEERICGIVSKQHRGAYDRAALLTIACTELLQRIEPVEAARFHSKIKNRFPRHSAFQTELRQAEMYS